MSDEIIVGIQVGRVKFSFRTDGKGSNINEAVKSIRGILSTHESLFSSFRAEQPGTRDVPRTHVGTPKKRVGRAETSIILRKMEDLLIPKGYFKDARTTSDVKAELKKQTGIDFTSRKVSQALGVLFEKDTLSRIGSKQNFHYVE